MKLLSIGSFITNTQGSFTAGETLAQMLSLNGVEVYLASRQPKKVLRLLDMLYSTWRLRSKIDIALVELYSGPAFFWAEASCWLLKRIKKPYILSLHGGNLPIFSKQHPKRVESLLKSAAAVTAPSSYLKSALSNLRPDIVWIPNPLKLEDYNTDLREKPYANFVWLRAFHHIYNPTLAVKALSLLLADYPEAHLLMVGPDKGDGSLQETQRLARELGVQDHIEFLGAVPKSEVPAILSRGDIFLNTTNFDNTPVSVLEAMASGLGVVSTNVGGIPYLLEHEVDSLLVEPDNPEEMAEAVHRLLSEPILASRLTIEARHKVDQFDWEFVLPQWLDLIGKHSIRL